MNLRRSRIRVASAMLLSVLSLLTLAFMVPWWVTLTMFALAVVNWVWFFVDHRARERTAQRR